MSYFTFDKTERPIALIKGGIDDGRIIFLGEEKEENNEPCCRRCSANCNDDYRCCNKCDGGCFDELTGGNEYDRIFGKEIKKVKMGHLPYINIKDDGVIIPIPRIVKAGELKRENVFISAPEEAGKSFWASRYVEQYLKMYPKAKFFLFSGQDKDEQLDKLKPFRMKLDKKLIDKPLQPAEFPNRSIIVFDDINGLSDKKLQKEIASLRDRLLEKGRHKCLFILSLNHNPTNGNETKASLSEASSIVLFPKGGDVHHIDYVMKKYLGYSTKNIKDLKGLGVRWLQCHKRSPQFILHEKGCLFS